MRVMTETITPTRLALNFRGAQTPGLAAVAGKSLSRLKARKILLIIIIDKNPYFGAYTLRMYFVSSVLR